MEGLTEFVSKSFTYSKEENDSKQEDVSEIKTEEKSALDLTISSEPRDLTLHARTERAICSPGLRHSPSPPPLSTRVASMENLDTSDNGLYLFYESLKKINLWYIWHV